MKRTTHIWLAATLLTGTLVSVCSAQSDSLGDYARAARKESKPAATKKFDNDNMPRTETLNVVGTPSDASTPAQTADASATSMPQDGNAAAQGADPAADKKRAADDWKTKLADQKSKLDLLTRELDVAQREYRLRAAVMYADAGNRLRNSAAWDKEDADYKKNIADKQKAVDDTKKSLDGLQEQARKAGVDSK